VRKIVAAVLGMTLLVAMALPAQASPTEYRYKQFFCSHSKTHASVKLWEYGKSGVMQFEVTFVAQEYYNGYWHNLKRHTDSSKVFSDTAGSHYYGYVHYAYTWSTHRYHREEVRMIWWHRYPNYVVAHKTLYT
jgi:hypothetical protein